MAIKSTIDRDSSSPILPLRVSRRSLRLCVFFTLLFSLPATADVIRREIESGAVASVVNGRRLGLEVTPASSRDAQRFLQKFLAIESEWVAYRGAARTFIPADRLKLETRRRVLLAVYPNDFVDERGWLHEVTYEGETLYSLGEWIVGSGRNQSKIQDEKGRALQSDVLKPGQRVLIPFDLLPPIMRQPTPDRAATAEPEPKIEVAKAVPTKTEPAPSIPKSSPPKAAPAAAKVEEKPISQAEAKKSANKTRDILDRLRDGLPIPPVETKLDGLLEYGADSKGAYASYNLRKGEALFSSVVVRFTDYQEYADVAQACTVIAKRSGIPDVTDIDAGSEIRIPLDMLSDRYKPDDSPERREYVASVKESERLRTASVRSIDLSGVVVILDAGHGGADYGAAHVASGLYEDEINYDVVCRIRALLESQTGAKVYVTTFDTSQKWAISNATRFTHDRDEQLLTNPPYNLDDAKVGVNLRYMLVNSIYDRELRDGIDPRKIIFTSIHTDSLYNENLRGTMVYIPGARLRRESETRGDAIYARYEEGRRFNKFTSTSDERKLDEALSRNFAIVLLDELGQKKIKRHDNGDPIRSQIVRSGQSPMVPGVLRNTKVPTKVLVETANLVNATDRSRLADPAWRQSFAEGYVDALRRHFGGDPSPGTRHTVEAD